MDVCVYECITDGWMHKRIGGGYMDTWMDAWEQNDDFRAL